MSSLDHTGSVERSLTPHISLCRQLPGAILLTMAGAVVIVGLVLQNYYVVATLPAVLLLMRYPVELSLGVFAFLVPFDSVLAIGHTGYTVNWLWGAAAGAVLFAYGLVSGRLKTPPRAALWWGLFTFWAAATLFWALEPAQALERLPSAVCLFLFYLVAVSFRINQRELRTVVLLAIAGGVLAAGYTLREFAQGTGWFSRASLVVNGQMANPNELADTLLLPLSLALGGFLVTQTVLGRSSMLVAAAIMALCVLLTMSRASVLALVLVLLIYLVRLGVRGRLLVLIALIPVLVVFLPDLFFLRVQESLTSRGEGRWDIFIVGMQIVRHYGIWGAGLGNFRTAYDKFAGFAPVFRGFDRDPHNIYLQVWAEMGIIGFLLFVAAIWSQIRDLHLANREQSGPPNFPLLAIEAVCWALLVHGLAANILWRKQFWMVWILAALVPQLQHVSETRKTPWTPLPPG